MEEPYKNASEIHKEFYEVPENFREVPVRDPLLCGSGAQIIPMHGKIK